MDLHPWNTVPQTPPALQLADFGEDLFSGRESPLFGGRASPLTALPAAPPLCQSAQKKPVRADVLTTEAVEMADLFLELPALCPPPPQPTPKRARSGVRLPRTVPVSPLNKLKQEVACDARSRRAVGLPALPRVDARRLPARGPAAPDLRLCDEVDLLFAAALFDSCCCVEGAESTVTLGAFECELCIGAVRFSLVGLVGGGSIALLDAVAVHPDWRRSGTGSRLVAAARGSASPPLLLVQSPEPSVAFFARIGESGPRARALLLSAVSAGATDVVAGTVPRVV